MRVAVVPFMGVAVTVVVIMVGVLSRRRNGAVLPGDGRADGQRQHGH